MPFFADPLHDEFGTWPLGLAPYGGGDVREVSAVAAQVSATATTPDEEGVR